MHGFNLSAWSVTHRSLTGFLVVLLFAGGLFSYLRLGRAEDPPFTMKLLTVTAAWPGATAQEMQDQVADRIEVKLQDLRQLDHIDTYVRPGFSASVVSWRDDTSPAEVPELFYQARKKLDDLRPSIPAGVMGPVVNDEYADVYGAMFAVTGADNAELVRQAERVRDRFQRVPGAEKVNITGEVPRAFFVEFSNPRLNSLGVSVPDIAAALAGQNDVVPSGIVETNNTRVPVRVEGALSGARALAEVPVSAGGRSVRLGDIATISRGYQDPPQFTVRHNGQPAVLVAVSMAKGTNGLVFGRALHDAADELRADLPLGLELQQVTDQPQVIGEEVGEFLMKFAVALGVVLLVSFLTLGLRVGIVVALAVPLTLSIVFIIMTQVGIELQRISLGALIVSLGLLVDDAIIAIETMVVKLEEGWDRVRAATFAWTSTAFPMLSGTLVTIAGFLPIGLAKSTAGEYAGGIFWVTGLALLASWVVAVLFTPYLGVLLLPTPKPRSHTEIYSTRPYRALRRGVRWSVQHRKLVVAGTVFLLVAALGGMTLVQQQFFPSSTRRELLVDVTLRQGAGHAATEAVVERLEAMLAKDPDVRWYTSTIGAGPPRFFLAFNPALPNDSIATVLLNTADGEARERVRARLIAAERNEVIPEAKLRVSRLEMGPPVGFPVQFRVVGRNLADVRATADRVLETLRNVPGTRDAQLAWSERAPSVRLELDQARIRELGLTPGEIGQTLTALISGVTATQVRDRTKLVDVVLRATPDGRLDLAALPDLVIQTSAGPMTVAQLARIRPQTEEPILWRRNRESFLTVQAEVQEGQQPPDVTAAALPAIRALALPAGVHIETGGATEESDKANVALFGIFPLMFATMALLLMVQLQNFGRTVLVMATAPLGIIGAVAALLLANAAFGFLALVGVIALAGMIMRNTVILVDQVRQDQEAGLSLGEAIVESTVRRARPVVLTALAAAFAFMPLAVNQFWGPMALTMIGGLVVATALTLGFLPALYALAFRVPRLDAAAQGEIVGDHMTGAPQHSVP